MGKSENDEAYERGVRDGLDGDFFDDLANCFVFKAGDEKEEIYWKGHKWGVEHRTYKEPEKKTDSTSSWEDFWGTEETEEETEREEPVRETSYGGSDYSYNSSPVEISATGVFIFLGIISLIILFFVAMVNFSAIETHFIKKNWPNYETNEEMAIRIEAEKPENIEKEKTKKIRNGIKNWRQKDYTFLLDSYYYIENYVWASGFLKKGGTDENSIYDENSVYYFGVIFSEDKGNNWRIISYENEPLGGIKMLSYGSKISFLNGKDGFIIINRGIFYGSDLIKTTNGGKNWQFILTTNNRYFPGRCIYGIREIDARNSENIDALLMSFGVIEKISTTNGGKKWEFFRGGGLSAITYDKGFSWEIMNDASIP